MMAGEIGGSTMGADERNVLDLNRRLLLGRLAPVIVHEFNNLMTPVLARAQDAVERHDVAAMRKALSVTVRQTERAMQLARRVLELAGDEGPAARSCSLLGLVEAAIESVVRPFDKDGVELRVDVPKDVQVMAEPLLFVQLLMNLLLNAKAAIEGRRGRISVDARRDVGNIVITVSDTGVGFATEADCDRINQFLEADPEAYPGEWRSSGLGLQVCRLIARRHNALIVARANDSVGATFKITWPAR